MSEPIYVWRVAERATEIGEDELNIHFQTVAQWEQRDRQALFAADGLRIEVASVSTDPA